MFPNRVARGDDGQFNAGAIFNPKSFASAGFVGRILKNKNAEQSIGLPCEYFVSFARVGRIVFGGIEADDARVGLLHQRPGALGVLREQIPTILSVRADVIRIIIAAAPFDEGIVGRSSRESVVDRGRTELRELREARRPAKLHPPARRIGPVAWMVKKISLEPLNIVAVGLHKSDGAALR